MGGHAVTPDIERMAEDLGAAIAKEGWILLNGGRNQGTMAAAARGAHEAGGFTIGIHPGLPGDDDVAGGLDVVVYTGMGYARNMINVLTADVVVALPGAFGTLNEVAYAKTYRRPVILYGFDDKQWFGDAVTRTTQLDECIAAVRAVLASAVLPGGSA